MALVSDEADDAKVYAPDLRLREWVFECGRAAAGSARRVELEALVRARLSEQEMAPVYEAVCAELGWAVDSALLEAMKEKNAAKFAACEARIADCKENLGESEVFDAMLERANYACAIGDKDASWKYLEEAYAKTVGVGARIDVVLTMIRVGFFWLIDAGGDWDRRNRLRVYEGLLFMCARDFKRASERFIESVATFTSSELFSFDKLVEYVIITSLLALDRPELKQKIVRSPEVLSAIDKVSFLRPLVFSLYECQYGAGMLALCDATDALAFDRYLARHAAYFCREMRIKFFAQYLDSYRSVSLVSMAATFGIGVDFLDRELSGFIAANRVHCKIDKVAGIVESTRVNTRNAQYATAIREGDTLLHRLQKLSRVVHV